jgi:hypothetical protein
MSSGIGTATIDFGVHPGSNEASVAVTGQSAISGTSKAEAFFMANDTSSNHTAPDHRYAPTFIELTCGTPSAGTGFTIHARSHHKMTGEWSVRWVWSD